MSVRNKDQYTLIERRHLNKVLEEQRFSTSGITDIDTVKVGKILNLDIIVLRLIYENSQVTKVLKVDTGEVLLSKTYETKRETKYKGWICYGTIEKDFYFYDDSSTTKVSENITRVWSKVVYISHLVDPKGWKEKNKDFLKHIKEQKLSKGDYNKLDHRITLHEIDCLKNTWKSVKFVDYSVDGEVLLNYDIPSPQTNLIIPDTIMDGLRRKVCEW